MKNFIRQIPNLLTLGNLLCGTAGVIAIFRSDIFFAAGFIWIGSFFDFLDGFTARLFKAYSDMGKELDSLADMVTFGALPALIIFEFMSGILPDGSILPYVSFLTVAFSALRLAKFNIDEGQKDMFTGLPTPANAFLLSGLPFLSQVPVMNFVATPGFLVVSVVISSLLMVTPARFISLKFSGIKDPANIYRYSIIIISMLFIVLMKARGISLAVISYMVISLVSDLAGGRNELTLEQKGKLNQAKDQ
ncbi:MAG TPA: CDP-diacylglycerol--serine O-phosphatidyltransferase [Cyclobacteriaceae bacterium]|nr:CDP-diacylglycerol--serine O-phosphatidyltransferase [Cyclobacteriaceae bacterium]